MNQTKHDTVVWSNDSELFEMMRKQLFTAVVGDVLDSLGYRRQFLPQGIKPIACSMVVAGRAMPVLEADYFADEGRMELSLRPFGYLFEALDDLRTNEVYITNGASLNYALWGGLMSTRALKLGAAGAVMNGFHRDTPEILALDFPTFSMGSYAQDQRGRGKVLDWRVPIEIGGVRIHPGDIVYGDVDGVLVIPQAVENEAIRLAWEKANTENHVRKAVENGMGTVEAFDKFGVM